MSREIERKWLLKTLPKIVWESKVEIKQIYVFSKDKVEIRLRLLDNHRCILTQKIGKGLSREEFEVELPTEAYHVLERLSLGRRIHKVRHKKDGWEIDAFKTLHLFLMEKEFGSEEEARDVVFPTWLQDFIIKEVTDDYRYTNKNIALHGLPSE
jgi:CYTH domain-containing protein